MWRPPGDVDALAHAWRTAAPFPHVVIDDFVDPAQLAELLAILDEEHVDPYEGDLFAFEASAPEPATAELRAVRDDFAATLCDPLARITGKATTRADMRAYAYRPGHYLLPHTDHRDGLDRALAYAYYLPSPTPPVDGALELFRCTVAGGVLTSTTTAVMIAPRPNRLVVFDVGDATLHQVREVLGGLRLSLAGWFYP